MAVAEAVEMRFVLTDDDYAEVFRRVLRRGPLSEVLGWARLSAILPVALASLAAWKGDVSAVLWYVPVAVGTVGLALGAPWIAEWVYRASLTRQPHRSEETAVLLSGDGVHLRSAHQDERLRWGQVAGVVAYPDGWLLEVGAKAHWLPVSGLVDPADVEALEGLLERAVARFVRR